MKKLTLFSLAVFFSFSLLANLVSVDIAEKAARNYYAAMYNSIKKQAPNKIMLDLDFSYSLSEKLQPNTGNQKQLVLFYVFNINEDDGFVIISAEDCVYPIIGYALEGNFTGENLPPGLINLLDQYAQEINYAVTEKLAIHKKIKLSWSNILKGDIINNFKSISAVDPLVATKWDQGAYYNELCPFDNTYNELTVTGCVATAMAMIMKYWDYPETGTGYHSYNTNSYGTLSANFGAETYNWGSMPISVNSSNIAVATLMAHCGVAVEMSYGVGATGGSSAYVIEAYSATQYCAEYAYKNFFGYKNSTLGVLRENYDEATWIQMLKDDLDAGKPIQYAGFGSGGGHTWVCDGYDNNNNFHMNWGWSGTHDGYYSVNELTPGVGGAGGGSGSFTDGQQALFGIEPANGGGGGTTQFDLRAYSAITVNPNPINFANAFDVNVDIGNFDDSDFSGSLSAILFNSEGEFVDFIQELTGINLPIENYSSYTFHTDGMLAVPGEYSIGIYYKPNGGDWAIIAPGDYSNYLSINIVGPDNTMQMYSDISISTSPIVSNELFEVTFDIANFGTQTFSGEVSADLYDSEGNYLYELAIGTIELESGYSINLSFENPGVDVEAGSYILAIWDLPSGGEWELVGSDEFSNPIFVEIAEPSVQPDIYEDNNIEENAYNLQYSGNTQETITTDGSNIHEGNDMDFYKIELPAGSQYKFTARAHDSYNSGNGNTYTDDVLWAFIYDEEMSDVYDDVLDGYFVVNGGQPAYFVVSNYYQGSTGTYLLEMSIEKGNFGIDELKDPDFINIFPNPANTYINISARNWDELELPVDIELINSIGQAVYTLENVNPGPNNLKIELPVLPEGQYYLRITGKQLYIEKKVLIIK